MLLTVTALVVFRTYRLWEKGPWDLPNPAKSKELLVSEEAVKESSKPQSVSTKVILDKNLFDPERGAGQMQEGAASSAALQRIRSMVLVGTAILGNSRYAILQEPSDSRPTPPRSQSAPPILLRLKLGDTVEGFKLSEVYDKKVVFAKGASKLEIVLDFSRKVEEPRQKTPPPQPLPRPAPSPRVPRPQGQPSQAPQANP